MKNSVLISLLFIVCCRTHECQAQQHADIPAESYSQFWLPLFPPDFGKGLFKMTFDISKYHLTGLLIVKQTTTSSVRMVFTNEMGMQFFDLEFTDDRFIVHSIFPSMNKRALLTLLEKDFRMILFQNHNIKKVSILRSKIPETEKYLVRNGHGTFIFIVDTKTKKITGITTHRSILSKTLLSVTHTREGLPNQISIYNPTQKLHINLLLLSD